MTPLERLKALAAAKKQKETSDAPTSVPTVPAQHPAVVPGVPEISDSGETPTQPETEVQEAPVPAAQGAEVSGSSEVQALVAASSETGVDAPLQKAHDHPLLMELAELEQALTQKLPEFRTILRDIHGKLRQDPAVVTVLSEEDIGLIVTGMMVHANQDVAVPKAIKATKAAKKVPLSADDL